MYSRGGCCYFTSVPVMADGIGVYEYCIPQANALVQECVSVWRCGEDVAFQESVGVYRCWSGCCIPGVDVAFQEYTNVVFQKCFISV